MILFLIKKNIFIVFFLIFCFIGLPAFAANPVIIPDAKLKLTNNKNSKSNQYIASTQFTKKEITQSPVTNLSQFLKQEQSIVRLTNNSGDSSQTALSLRGFGDNAAANSLILVDGFPLMNPSLLAPNFNSIPLSDIERIEIFQGSEGSLWGNQAVGGVVNIITKHPKKFIVNAIASLGSYNTYYDNILIGDKKENGFFYKIFGLIGKTDNYRNHNQQKTNNIAGQVGLDYARGTLSLYAQSYGDTVYFPGGLSEEQFLQNPRLATNFENYSRYRTNVFQFLNKHELNNQWVLETRVNRHETNGDGFVYLNFDRNDTVTSIHPRLIGSIYRNKIIAGYYGEISRYELTNSKVQANTSAKENDLYFQTILPLANQVDFILGARKAWQTSRIEPIAGQVVNANNQVFVSEQGLVFHPRENWSFFLRRDGNFSFPKANEQTWAPDNVKSLRVQTGTSYEAGTEWQTEKSKTQLNIYRLALDNEIAFNPAQTINQPFGAFNNLDQTLRYGIGISEQYRLTPKATINGQLNYVDARFASGPFSGNLIPAVPAINGNAGLRYAWTTNWITEYTLLYTGSRYASEDVENVGKRISAYWLSDIALQYFRNSYSLNFEIHNLFNQNYPNYAYYDSFTRQNVYYPAAGRNYLITFKLNID